MALLQASSLFSATWRESNQGSNPGPATALQSRCVSSWKGASLAAGLPRRTGVRTNGRRQRWAPVRAKQEVVVVDKTIQVGNHALDNFSNYIFHQIKRPFAQYIPDGWDPLKFLPVNIHSNLQKSEAIATLVVRETLVFTAFYLAYKEVNTFCRWMYRVYTYKHRAGEEFDEAAFEESPFRAARSPLRSLIMTWASTRLLEVTAVVWKLQALITPLAIYKIRAGSAVCTITWFFFRWKRLYVDELVKVRPQEEPRIMAIDKITSLAMYGLAGSCIAEVMGLALGSLLAVGGVSGLAVGLAAKEVVGNMFGGAALFLNRPFIIGEKIKAGNVSGHVQDIGFMQTKVQGFDGVPVLVPNQAFTSQVITNFSRAKTRVLEASFQLNNRHIFLVHGITEQVQAYLHSHASVETEKATPMCYLKGMQKDGPEIALSCTIKSTGGALFYKIQQEILIHVAQLITDSLGPDSPFTPLKVPSPPVDATNINSNKDAQLIL